MTDNTNSRHWIVALVLQVGIRLRFLYETGCGLSAIILSNSAYPSPWRPKNAPKYDFITVLGFNILWIVVGLCRELILPYYLLSCTGGLYVLQLVHDYLCHRLQSQCEVNGCNANQNVEEIPVPEYDWRNGDPETFYKTFVQRPHPVVLRGFMQDAELLKELKWHNMLTEYGNTDVSLTKKELDGYVGKLSEVEDQNVYLHNSETLFLMHSKLRDLFQYHRLEPYLHMKVGYEQVFVGKEGTGSPFHHAAVYNMFYQIDGRKRWYFIDPYDHYLAYPLAILGRAANFLMVLWPGKYNREAFPLFRYCPVYGTTLEPGDVLFNPPWWWHSVENVSEQTVGVASRWHSDGIAGHRLVMTEEDYTIDRIASLNFMLGKSSFPFLHAILQTPSPKFDEHMTLREKSNRYVHRQLEAGEKGGIEVFGTRTKF
jgi:hypothetical protein